MSSKDMDYSLRDNERNFDVVISGISGAYPNCENVKELAEKLYAKENLITTLDSSEKNDVTSYMGKLKSLNKFDASYFVMHQKMADGLNPEIRMLLEKTFEAIYDSGLNPKTLRGTNTGVFTGMCLPDRSPTMDIINAMDSGNNEGIQLCGNHRFANVISYYFDLKGPSCSIDTACSSSSFAFVEAYNAILSGKCDAAIVATASTFFNNSSLQVFSQFGLLAKDGKCKVFDEAGNGFVPSEAICVMLLQKSDVAHRIYATVVNAMCNNDGFKLEGQPHPSREMQAQLLSKFYTETKVDTNDIFWIETHGTGTVAGDKAEASALCDVFARDNNNPLFLGSIKSNVGHTQGPAGLVGITKIIIAMENGLIPANINYKIPRKDIEALMEGRIKVLIENTKWDGGLVGSNSFGIGGANSHILLKSHEKLKSKNSPTTNDIPRAVYVSGRTEEAVETIISQFETSEVDDEEIRLFHEIHQENIQGHLYRGYIVLSNEGKAIKHIQEYSEKERPIWFLFSGMGSQLPGMAKELMRLPTFNESMTRMHKVMKPHGVDLIKVVTEDEKSLLNSFIGITAVQIALVDILKQLDIIPQGVIGHSFGEIACAYVDGCLTAEQAILCSYYRGKCSSDGDTIVGIMATIGLGYNEILSLLPASIEVACHTSSTNCTISGPDDDVKNLMDDLHGRGIFAKALDTDEIAYHSKYIDSVAAEYLKFLRNVIPVKKLKSARWISTSIPESDWANDSSNYISAEYFADNLTRPVLFEEASVHIPHNALLIEIAPQAILLNILRRSLNENIINIPLFQRNALGTIKADDLTLFLCSLGRIFEEGLHPKIHTLYPQIKFPVSKGTPMISPLIRWEHSNDWAVHKYKMKCNGVRDVKISLQNERYKYLEGHLVDGKTVFPATGYLVLVWETLALMSECYNYMDLSVVFEDVKFMRATVIPDQGSITLNINIHAEQGNFIVSNKGSTCVQGNIKVLDSSQSTNRTSKLIPDYQSDSFHLQPDDIYKEFQISGIQHKGEFRGLLEVHRDGTMGKIKWNDNYVTFIDSMLQTAAFSRKSRDLAIPTSIRKIIINVDKQKSMLENNSDFVLPVVVSRGKDEIASGGVCVTAMKMTKINRRAVSKQPVLRKYQFVPFFNYEGCSFREGIEVSFNIIVDVINSVNFSAIEILNDDTPKDDLVSNTLMECVNDWLSIQPEITIFTKTGNSNGLDIDDGIMVQRGNLKSTIKSFLVIVHDIGNNPTKNLKTILPGKFEGSYILCVEHESTNLDLSEIDAVSCMNYVCDGKKLILLRKKSPAIDEGELIAMKIELEDYSWIEKLQNIIKDTETEENRKIIVIYSEGEQINGIIGFYKCLIREISTSNLRCFFIPDTDAPTFSLDNEFYKVQLKKNCPLNVYKDGEWGTYCHLDMQTDETISTDHAYIDVLRPGDLSSVKWIEGPINSYRNIQETEKTGWQNFYVHYCALNFRDVMLSTGRLPQIFTITEDSQEDYPIGFEFSAVASDGKRYMGASRGNSLATQITFEADVDGYLTGLTEVPDEWTLEDAATVPVIYTTVISALIKEANIQRGESILIHSGTGGVGQAAINVALHFGCRIFTTVGTNEKREFIKKHFPQIPECNIGNSRDISFEDMIDEQTNGRGVDVVLNSLSEKKLIASVRCLSHGGRFIEIGLYDILQNNPLGLEPFLNGISFHSVELIKTKILGGKWVTELLRKGIQDGYIKPIVRQVFQKNQVEEAFRYMSSGKHIGKILIKVRNEEDGHKPMYVDALPRYLCFVEHSYIVCGGLGGFGLELVDWLVSRGAKKIVISSRTGIQNSFQKFRCEKWNLSGAKILISTDDITNENGVKSLLQKANQMGTISAIFNLAVVLQDSLYENQNEQKFSTVTAAKITATYHLDKLSRTMCPSLQHFVVFSSIVCGLGTVGQTNYGWANSSAERICEERRKMGFPALAIQWGAIADVGLVAKMSEEKPNTLNFISKQSIPSCLEALDKFMQQSEGIVSSWIPLDKRIKSKSGDQSVFERIIGVLGIKDLKSISTKTTLAAAGIDSFATNEVRQILETDYDMVLTVAQVRSLTFEKLNELSSKSMEIVDQTDLLKKQMSLVAMSTLIPNIPLENSISIPFTKVKESGADTSNVFYFPGFTDDTIGAEGVLKLLECDVICLHYYDTSCNEFDYLCNKALLTVKNHLKKNKPFNIIAYSFGGIVAMEVIRLLEAEGINGKLWLIESSPLYIEEMAKTGMSNTDENVITSLVQSRLLKLCIGDPDLYEDFLNELKMKNIETWEGKLKLAFSLLPEDRKVYKEEYLTNLVDTYTRRFITTATCTTNISKQLETRTTLIRITKPIALTDMEYDYGLKKYFSNPVDVRILESDHYTILRNEEVAVIIKQGFMK